MPKDYYKAGYKLVSAWIRPEYHAALKAKLAQDQLSLIAFFERFVLAYTGCPKVEKNAATGKVDPPAQS